MNAQKKIVFYLIITLVGNLQLLKAENQPLKLWYNQPASEWMKSLPLGNGRLGAMVFGGIQKETIALNEITMWAGKEDPDQEHIVGKEKLREIREYFFKGEIEKGNESAGKVLVGKPHSFGTHLPVGNLNLQFDYPDGKIQNYYRDLNLDNAVASVTFDKGGVKYTREFLNSNPDDVLVVKLMASKKAALNFSVSLDLLRKAEISAKNNVLEFAGDMSKEPSGGVAFLGNIRIKNEDGTVSAQGNKLKISNATTVYLFIDIRTNFQTIADFKTVCRHATDNASKKIYEELKAKHIADYQKLFKRVELFLGNSETDDLPTDLRWLLVKEGKSDAGMDALFFQYARYLLIASSRENSPLPANLQGLWNDNLANNMGWTCDYHLDINTEQNYWLANIGNLRECNAPLFDYIDDLASYGQKTVRNLYGSPGWTAHTMANVWGFTAPGWDTGWGLFPTGGTWIASHLWSHYCYTQDKNFLRQRAYPVLKENARFLLNYMTIDPRNGYLVTGPSTSPENGFSYNGKGISLSMMPTVDRVLVVELFDALIKASEILKTDKLFRDSLQKALKKLPPMQISKRYGIVQEWMEDYEEAYRNHRHTSHLLGLYPFSQITPEKTPELAVAAKETLVRRLTDPNWEDTEWSRANMICFDARLKNPVDAYESVVLLQRNFTRENLLTISPKGIAGAPYDIFIFDGNEAGAAGIAEMLIQGHSGYIQFLPALPEQWKTGYFKGLCVEGGGVVDLEWRDGKVEIATLKATLDNSFALKLKAGELPTLSVNGVKKTFKYDSNGLIQVRLKRNDIMTIRYE